MAPVVPAHAADFGDPTTDLPRSIEAPTQAGSLPFTVTFTGSPVTSDVTYAPTDAAGNGPTVTVVDTNRVVNITAPTVDAPSPTALVPGTAVGYGVHADEGVTPGRYRTVIPIRQVASGVSTVKAVTTEFFVIANPSVTVVQSDLTVLGKPKFNKSSKWQWKFTGPEYVKGASLKVYYQAKGKKSFKVVATTKLNAAGDATFRGKRGAIRKVGKAYFRVGPVKYSPVTKSDLYDIKKG